MAGGRGQRESKASQFHMMFLPKEGDPDSRRFQGRRGDVSGGGGEDFSSL